MGTPTKMRKSQSVMVVCLVLALLCSNMNRARCFNSIQTGDWGNSNYSTATPTPTRRVQDVIDDEEEFLMESGVNRRILDAGGGGIRYDALRGGNVICSSPGRYADCLPTYNAYRRPCGIENRCSRND